MSRRVIFFVGLSAIGLMGCCCTMPATQTPEQIQAARERRAKEAEEREVQRVKLAEVNADKKAKREEEAVKARQKAAAESWQRKEEAAAKPQPNRNNYNKVKNGMSIDEVEAILGPGKEAASGPGVVIATWQSSGFSPTIISVTFQNGQVQSKAIAGP